MDDIIIFSLPQSKYFFQFVIGKGDCYFDFVPFANQALPLTFKGEVKKIELNHLNTEWKNLKNGKVEATTFDDYTLMFNQIQNHIQSGKVAKVILSKLTIVNNTLDFEQIKMILNRLRVKNPNAFVYFLSNESSGTWIGASPELLIKQKNQMAQTIALAGTKFLEEDNWTNKEYEEQKIVSDYIQNILKKFQLDFNQSDLTTVQSGSIYHLANHFEIHNLTNEILSKFLNEIHPTPAISGFPKNESIAIINEVENHLRSYYCGYLGVRMNNEVFYFINLRCAQIYNNRVVAYSGGGITQDSDCLKEWTECNKKSEAILSVL